MSAVLFSRVRRIPLWRSLVLAGTALTAVPLTLGISGDAWAVCASLNTISATCNSSTTVILTGNLTINAGTTAMFSGSTGFRIDSGTSHTFMNSGTVTGADAIALTVGGSPTQVLNTETGTLAGVYGVFLSSSGVLNGFINQGTIHGTSVGLLVGGTLSAPAVNSGILAGGVALQINPNSTFTSFTNTGKILGTISNSASSNLTINGADGDNYGIITGYINGSNVNISSAGTGLIMNNASDLTFAYNTLLNSSVNLGTHTMNIASNGKVQVNNPLTITGNLTSSGVLAFGVGSGGNGKLTVSGNVDISGGTLVLKALNGTTLQSGQNYKVIFADGTLNSAAQLVVSGFNSSYEIIDENSQNYLKITIGDVSSTSSATGTATASTATPAVEAVKTLPVTTQTLQLTAAIDALSSTAEANKAGNQLRPAANGVSSQAAQAAGAQVMNVVAGRNDAMRIASDGNGRQTGIATGDVLQGLAFWTEGFGVNTSQSHRKMVDGYSAWTGGMAAGADTQVSDNTRVGLVGSYAYTDVGDEGDRRGSGTTISSYGATLYASYSPGDWYLDGSAGLGLHRYHTSRRMDFTGFNATASGQHDAWQYLARADAGYPLALGSMLGDAVLTPIAGMAVSRLEERAYTEKGGNGAALHINAVDSNSVKSTLGVKLARSLETGWGEVTPQIKLGWLHEFADVGQSSTSSYVAGGTPFSTPGVHQPRDAMLAGLGLTLVSGSGYTLSANYDVEVKTDYVSQAGRLRFRSEF